MSGGATAHATPAPEVLNGAQEMTALPRPWWQRRFFPRPERRETRMAVRLMGGRCPYITSYVDVHVGWADRLRLLVSGRVALEIVTFTTVDVPTSDSIASFWVEPPTR